jgi:parvulin-like peptidyl-prolyl isomerase
MRFRASHVFLAAPPETRAEVVEAKRSAIKGFSERIARGEKLVDLVSVASEDEATRTRGGDLNYFSESRMPPYFFAAVKGCAWEKPVRLFVLDLALKLSN